MSPDILAKVFDVYKIPHTSDKNPVIQISQSSADDKRKRQAVEKPIFMSKNQKYKKARDGDRHKNDKENPLAVFGHFIALSEKVEKVKAHRRLIVYGEKKTQKIWNKRDFLPILHAMRNQILAQKVYKKRCAYDGKLPPRDGEIGFDRFFRDFYHDFTFTLF